MDYIIIRRGVNSSLYTMENLTANMKFWNTRESTFIVLLCALCSCGEILYGVLNLICPTFFCACESTKEPRENAVKPRGRFPRFSLKQTIHGTSWSLEKALWCTVDRFPRCPVKRFPRCPVENFHGAPWCPWTIFFTDGYHGNL